MDLTPANVSRQPRLASAPLWLSTWLNQVRGLRKGAFYGLTRPAWWPAAYWPARDWFVRRGSSRLANWFGPEHPYDGKRVELKVRSTSVNAVNTANAVYAFVPVVYGRYRGHMCEGRLSADVPILAAYLSALGYPAEDAPLLAAVSALEGNFDSIQTYDRAKFSWGFIQFAGSGGLVGVLHQLKIDEPATFEQYFGRHGIDVAPGRLWVRRAVGQTVSLVSGGAALNCLHDEPRLWNYFLLASADEAVQRVQVKVAYERYFLHMLARVEQIGGVTISYGELFAHHRFGRAILYDRAVHRGVYYTARLFRQALEVAWAQEGALDADAVVDAARGLEPVAQHARWNKLHYLLEVDY